MTDFYVVERVKKLPRTLGSSPFAEMPSPTEQQMASPEFEAIWQVIKTWDVNVPEFYEGYCSANGSHVTLILEALNNLNKEK